MKVELPDRIPDAQPPYACVAFDCDSTLSAIEGIDELAGERRAEIEGLTARAMAGAVALEDVYRLRLELLRPSRAAITALGERYVAHAVPFARELAAALSALGKRVCIVSGGIRAAVLPLARALALREADVFAVEVYHGPDGSYAGFDERSALATTAGKLALVRSLPAPLAFVGDGVTDLIAAPAAARFVAFGGVVRRPEVFARARASSPGPDLARLVPWLLAPSEIAALALQGEHARLLRASGALESIPGDR